MSEQKSGNCHYCGITLGALDYGRQDLCSGCRRDTRVCKNCVHYDTSYNNHCKENQAERVVDKDKSNFCDYFSPQAGLKATGTTRESLRSAADALFRKKG